MEKFKSWPKTALGRETNINKKSILISILKFRKIQLKSLLTCVLANFQENGKNGNFKLAI